MISSGWMREQFMGDPLFVEVLRARGIDNLNRSRHPRTMAAMRRWEALEPRATGRSIPTAFPSPISRRKPTTSSGAPANLAPTMSA